MAGKNIGWVFDHSPYKAEKFAVHLALGDIANDTYENRIWVSQSELARKARVSRQAVNRILKQMVEDGFLEVVEDESNGKTGSIKTYRMKFPDVKTATTTTDENKAVTLQDTSVGGVTLEKLSPSDEKLSPSDSEAVTLEQIEPIYRTKGTKENSIAKIEKNNIHKINGNPLREKATEILKEYWDECKALNKPTPATNWNGLVTIIAKLLENGHPENRLKWALRAVPTISIRSIEFAINQRLASKEGGFVTAAQQYLEGAKG